MRKKYILIALFLMVSSLTACSTFGISSIGGTKSVNVIPKSSEYKPTEEETEKTLEALNSTNKVDINELKAKYNEKADSEKVYKIVECSPMPGNRVVVIYLTEQNIVKTHDITNAIAIGNIDITGIKGNYLVIKQFGDTSINYIVSKDLIKK